MKKKLNFLEKSIISHNLWNEYTRDHEYIKLKYDHGIRDDHPMIIEKESMGLKSIYKFFVIEKLRLRNSIDSFSMREPSEWLKEWKDMHSLLFRFVLNKNHLRKWRKVDVRFGSPGDEDNYKIPLLHMVSYEIEKLASNISTYISRTKIEDNEKYQILAKIHYEFIRIHPFKDENGRIARVLTDQISLFFGFPPALSGYPRHDLNRRLRYHKAINLCISDPQCLLLSEWIKSYIEAQTFQIS